MPCVDTGVNQWRVSWSMSDSAPFGVNGSLNVSVGHERGHSQPARARSIAFRRCVPSEVVHVGRADNHNGFALDEPVCLLVEVHAGYGIRLGLVQVSSPVHIRANPGNTLRRWLALPPGG